MEKTIDLEKPTFPLSAPVPPATQIPMPISQPTRVFQSLEEAFAAFDDDTDEGVKEYIIPTHALPPIPDTQTVVNQLMQNALLLVDSGDYELARNIFVEVLKKNSESIEAIRWLGWCFKQERKTKEAQEIYEKLITLRQSEQDHFELGEIYYEQGFNQLAIDQWQKALSVCDSESPRLFDLHKSLGNAFTKVGDYDSAEENYHKALTLRSHSDGLQVNLGTLAFQRQNLLEAMTHFKQALEINAYNDFAWTGVALVAKEMNDVEWAKSTLLKALDINPKNEVAQELLNQWGK